MPDREPGHRSPDLSRADDVLSPGAESMDLGRPDVEQLRTELAEAQAKLARRDHELNALRSDLHVTRELADKLRRTVSRSSRAIDQIRFASSMPRFVATRLSAITPLLHRLGWFGTGPTEAIRISGLFDAQWYLARYPDVAAAGMEPLRHYVEFGAMEGRDPHPLFDSDWYLSTYPEVALARSNPLAHYVNVGAAQGFDPGPLFHTAWYLKHNADAQEDGANPLSHYLAHATEKGRDPNPLFDSDWYCRQHPDIVAIGENPLVHYVLDGAPEGVDPHPLFDTQWYLSEYPRVTKMRMNPLQHYLTLGVIEGCRPGPPLAEEGAERRARKQTDPEIEPSPATSRPLTNGQSPARNGSASASTPIDLMRWRMNLGRPKRSTPRDPGQIGIFVHLFYQDIAGEIARLLSKLPFDFKIYASTDSNAKKLAIEATFKRFKLSERTVIKILPNIGWDIAPFLLGFADEIRGHDICLKLHAKKSASYARNFGNQWRDFLFSELIGDVDRAAFIVDSFVANPDLGALMAHHWRGVVRRVDVNAIGINFRPMRALLNRMGISIMRNQRIEFPSGSMFWFRGAALAPLLEAGLAWEDFGDCHNVDNDATIAHAVERSILFSAACAGYKWAFLPPRRGWQRIRGLKPQWRPRTAAPDVRIEH